MKKILIPLFLLLVSCTDEPLKKELEMLDCEISLIPEYGKKFEDDCDSLRRNLASAETDSARFEAIFDLYEKYSPTNLDSASRYASLMHDYTGTDKSRNTIERACRAICLIKKNEYRQAEDILGPSPVPEQTTDLAWKYYYRAKCWVLSTDKTRLDEVDSATDEYWQLDSTSAEALMLMARQKQRQKDFDRAGDLCRLAMERGNTHYYSATGNYLLSIISREQGDITSRKHYLILSAVSDIRNNAKEYESFFTLARVLFREKDYEHALKYIQMTVEDAVAANYSGRIAASIQANKMYNESYREAQASRHRTLTIFIIALASMTVLLITLTIQIRISNGKLSTSRQFLRERTIIQDRFLGEYMELASDYIGEVDKMRSKLRKTLRTGGIEQLSAILKAPGFADSEINNYYANFDQTFVSIFPDFVQKVSEITGIRQAEETPQGDRPTMTVDMRILALIRLGITNPTRISKILHISTGTVYTYLYRMRKASGLSPKAFISAIQSLCAM